ncbi:tRNA lysidine(34) synthetase TilS [Aureimonas ureilytica]|uniref:tRNA lysidine(34) synthetase TilS n=1 Tax=Aureimonas ureilytica TaxID=401562 RepID=UPI00036A1EFE|nr:tRNA lysidine(34) synthetase TilS [Aureimonas ureilytica]
MRDGGSAPGGAGPLDAAILALQAALASCPPDRRHGGLLLAVSGGPDSLALLLAGAEARASGRLPRAIEVATVDHGLRPESAAEAAEVARIARSLDLPHRTLFWNRTAPLRGNVSAKARAARYERLAAHAHAIGAGAILTAHHRDDQIETYLLARERGARGTALAGMRAWRDLEPGLVLLRPFLTLPKRDLVAIVERAGVCAADDPTNRDLRFARARLRAAPHSPSEERAILAALDAAGRLRTVEDEDLAARLDALVARGDLAVSPLGEVEWPTQATDARLLSRAVTAAGGALYPPAAEALDRLARRIDTEPQGASTLGGARVEWRAGHVRAGREYGREGPPDLLWPSNAPRACFDRRFDIERSPEDSWGRIAAYGRSGRGGARYGTLPITLDEAGVIRAVHPDLTRRAGDAAAVPLRLSCRVGWRVCADLVFPARAALTGRLQNAANHGEPVGKGVAYTYIRGQVEASCVDGRTVARAHFQDG